ncbi:hypothetical protein ACP4OV_021023 [Aristida adscensionis]
MEAAVGAHFSGLRLEALRLSSPSAPSSPSSARAAAAAHSNGVVYANGTAAAAAAASPAAAAAAELASPPAVRQPFVIGVSGGTASGKTTVCDMIIQQLHDHRVVLVNQDSFYRGLTAEESARAQDYNFDHPDAFDTEQLLECMGELKRAQPYGQLNEESEEKFKIVRKIKEIVDQRKHVENNIDFIGRFVFGFEKGPLMLKAVRTAGQPLVDNWDCLKKMVQIFESQCGSLTQYDMKYMRAFANMCNNGVSESKLMEASIGACSNYN